MCVIVQTAHTTWVVKFSIVVKQLKGGFLIYFSIDASKEDGTLGRLINDNHKSPNCTMKKIIVNDTPHLCLFAVKKIEIGSEIEYNYGDSQWPWRKKVSWLY